MTKQKALPRNSTRLNIPQNWRTATPKDKYSAILPISLYRLKDLLGNILSLRVGFVKEFRGKNIQTIYEFFVYFTKGILLVVGAGLRPRSLALHINCDFSDTIKASLALKGGGPLAVEGYILYIKLTYKRVSPCQLR